MSMLSNRDNVCSHAGRPPLNKVFWIDCNKLVRCIQCLFYHKKCANPLSLNKGVRDLMYSPVEPKKSY